jgi:hypothetical protein
VIDPPAERDDAYRYSVMNSNVICSVIDPFLTRQINLVTPVETFPVTAFGVSSDFRAMAPNGDVAFSANGVTWLQRKKDAQALAISANSGFPVYVGNRWYFIEGNTVLTVGEGTPDSYTAPGEIQLKVISPQTADWVADTVAVTGTISSSYRLKSISAGAGSQRVELYGSKPGTYSGHVPFSAGGDQTIAITATDFFGHSAQTIIPISAE